MLTIVASDGNGGTDQYTVVWYVTDQWPKPTAEIHLQNDDWPGREGVGLVRSGVAITGRVYFYYAPDPDTYYTVTLVVTPEGLGELSQSQFSLKHNQYADFEIEPLTASQRRQDGIVHVYVDGREVDRIHFTNVDVVFPQEPIRGPDTPEGMPDRISAGDDGNWGTYLGEIQVYPNLYGLHALDFDVVGPDDDPKWGDAQVEAVAYDELEHSSFVVAGTVQTQPGSAPGANANKLRVVASLVAFAGASNMSALAFSVASIPIAVKVIAANRQAATPKTVERVPMRFWGVKYDLETVPDAGALGYIQISEDIQVVRATGLFEGMVVVGSWLDPNDGIEDWNGKPLPGTADTAAAKLQSLITTKGGVFEANQKIRFYDQVFQARPASIADGLLVRCSGFSLIYSVKRQPMRLVITRLPKDFVGDPFPGRGHPSYFADYEVNPGSSLVGLPSWHRTDRP